MSESSTLVALFREPGFTAIVSAVLGALVTFGGNYLVQARKAKDTLCMERFRLGREERVQALADLMSLLAELTKHLDPREQLIGINRFKQIMTRHYDGTLEVKLAFVGDETAGLLNKLDELYAEAMFELVTDEHYEQFREKLRRELPDLVSRLRKAAKRELHDIA